MYAWLWRRLPGGPRARAVQLFVAAVAAVVACCLWVFPAVSTLLDRNGATVGSAPHPIDQHIDRTGRAMISAGEVQ